MQTIPSGRMDDKPVCRLCRGWDSIDPFSRLCRLCGAYTQLRRVIAEYQRAMVPSG